MPTDGSNLVLKVRCSICHTPAVHPAAHHLSVQALDLFRRHTGSSACFQVHLEKRVPAGAYTGHSVLADEHLRSCAPYMHLCGSSRLLQVLAWEEAAAMQPLRCGRPTRRLGAQPARPICCSGLGRLALTSPSSSLRAARTAQAGAACSLAQYRPAEQSACLTDVSPSVAEWCCCAGVRLWSPCSSACRPVRLCCWSSPR